MHPELNTWSENATSCAWTSVKWAENHCRPTLKAITRLLRDCVLMPRSCHACFLASVTPRWTPGWCLPGRRVSRPAPGSRGGAVRRWTGSGAGLSSDTERECLSGPFDADAAAAVRAAAAPPYSAWLYSPSAADAHLTETERDEFRRYANNNRAEYYTTDQTESVHSACNYYSQIKLKLHTQKLEKKKKISASWQGNISFWCTKITKTETEKK